MDVTIVVSTRTRAGSLRLLLDALSRQETGARWQALIVDNGSSDETAAVLAHASFPWLRHISEPDQGKSRALNRGLEQAAGDLVLFTDDDVLMEPNWVEGYWSAAKRHPTSAVLSGPVVPVFPPLSPAWLSNSGFAGAAFARFEHRPIEHWLPKTITPYGANAAVRRQAIGRLRFRCDLGPSGVANLMCEDVDFMRRVLGPSGSALFVPTAGVHHVLRQEMTLSSYQFERAFNLGRSKVIMTDRLDIGRTYRVPWSAGYSGLRYFDTGFAVNLHYGQLAELLSRGKEAEVAVGHLVACGMGWARGAGLESPSLEAFLAKYPQYEPLPRSTEPALASE